MGGVIMNERICTPPLEGLRRGDAHTNENTHHTPSLAGPQPNPPELQPPPATTKNTASQAPSPQPATTGGSTRGPQTAAPPPRRRAADRTESAHTRDRAPRSRTPRTGRGTAPRRPARRPTTAAARGHRRAPPVARRMQRSLVVQVQPLERRADLALRPTPLPRPSPPVPAPRPQIDQRPVRYCETMRDSPWPMSVS